MRTTTDDSVSAYCEDAHAHRQMLVCVCVCVIFERVRLVSSYYFRVAFLRSDVQLVARLFLLRV